MRRKVKLSRILILILIPILIVSGSVYVIYMLFTQEESVIEEKSYYDLNLFSLENGLMTYKDSLYKVSTGIDVSSHNGAVDWAAVKTDGIEFAMLRIGYRGAQEGILHEDEYFNTFDDYDLYLKNVYGDYMTPPPENKRGGHTDELGNIIFDLHKDYSEYKKELSEKYDQNEKI